MRENSQPQSQEPSDEELPSLGVALDLSPAALSNQMAQIDAIDTKAGFVLGSASLLTGVLAAWRVVVHAPGWIVWIPPILALCGYAAVIVFGVLGYKVREYHYAPSPMLLKERYLPLPPSTTRRDIFDDMVKAFDLNEETIAMKVKWLKLAFGALCCQAVIVAAILLLETWAISSN